MYRAPTTGNKKLHEMWVEHVKQLHKQRLKTIKPSIDNKPPKQYRHLKANMKRAQTEEGTSRRPRRTVVCDS